MANIRNAYQWSINACNNPDIGYSQEYRNARIIDGICYYDCSSFVWFALMSGGFDCIGAYNAAIGPYYGNAFTTWNMPEVLRVLGFRQHELNSQWQPADILIRNNHTELVYQGFYGQGRTMGAHSDDVPLPDQVSINNFVCTAASWEELWRYEGPVKDNRIIIPVIMG
jgi:hypothetical protein